jgi:hypothetical protein
VIGDRHLYRDEVGRCFGSVEDAREHARVIAGELAMDGAAYLDFAVCVIDDRGNAVAKGAPDSH